MTKQGSNAPAWKRSTRCVSDLHCVEVASWQGNVLIRNSTRPTGLLTVSKHQWRHFLAKVRSAERPE
ncbi:DUF397 domain-containing protein [Catenuloplanes atrovinosus]|uniref:DUF397 domain-containing protein n=1 Tax=Catenuloplanes atrovinosus TaxID=137266 RepID=UPI0035B555CC